MSGHGPPQNWRNLRTGCVAAQDLERRFPDRRDKPQMPIVPDVAEWLTDQDNELVGETATNVMREPHDDVGYNHL